MVPQFYWEVPRCASPSRTLAEQDSGCQPRAPPPDEASFVPSELWPRWLLFSIITEVSLAYPDSFLIILNLRAKCCIRLVIFNPCAPRICQTCNTRLCSRGHWLLFPAGLWP